MAKQPKISIEKMDKFRPQEENLNQHTQRGLGMLHNSMNEVGYVTPMTAAADGEILDGSARIEEAATVFGEEVIVVEHDGTLPIIMKRTDIPNAQTDLAKRLSILQNRVSEVDLKWDAEVLKQIRDTKPELLQGLWGEEEFRLLMLQAGIDTEYIPPMDLEDSLADEERKVTVKLVLNDSSIIEELITGVRGLITQRGYDVGIEIAR